MKNNIKAVFFAAILMGLVISLHGSCNAGEGAFEQLSLELKSQGVSEQFIKATQGPVKSMLSCAAPMADVRSVLLDLWSEGVKGRALKNAVTAVAELVKSGDNVLEAEKIASGAAHKAEAEGLSGFFVGMRVKKAVEERKAYLAALKK